MMVMICAHHHIVVELSDGVTPRRTSGYTSLAPEIIRTTKYNRVQNKVYNPPLAVGTYNALGFYSGAGAYFYYRYDAATKSFWEYDTRYAGPEVLIREKSNYSMVLIISVAMVMLIGFCVAGYYICIKNDHDHENKEMHLATPKHGGSPRISPRSSLKQRGVWPDGHDTHLKK